MTARDILEEQCLAYIRCRLQDELIVSAPEHWTTEHLEALEDARMKASKKRIARLTLQELTSATEIERHADVAISELRSSVNAAIHARNNNDTMGHVLNRLARSGLVSDQTAEAIFTEESVPLREIVDELLIGILDCEVLVRSDADASWNERRLIRACAAVAFLSALATAQEGERFYPVFSVLPACVLN
jgi:hypothetical protein